MPRLANRCRIRCVFTRDRPVFQRMFFCSIVPPSATKSLITFCSSSLRTRKTTSIAGAFPSPVGTGGGWASGCSSVSSGKIKAYPTTVATTKSGATNSSSQKVFGTSAAMPWPRPLKPPLTVKRSRPRTLMTTMRVRRSPSVWERICHSRLEMKHAL